MQKNRTRKRMKSLALLGGVSLAGAALAATWTSKVVPGSIVRVVTSGTNTRPPVPAATPAAAVKPAATLVAVPAATVPEPVPYVLGTMTWHFVGDAPQWKRDQINDSMSWVINQLNTLTDYHGSVRTVYSDGTPTADASFLGQVRFGGQTGRRTALHEMSHWLGSGSVRVFRQRVSANAFNNGITGLRVRSYDGPNGGMGSDGTHFWPYGMNYAREFVEPQRTIGMVAAQRADMGWGDGTFAITGDRRFQNRASRMLLDSGSGSVALQQPNGTAGTQIWRVGYVDGFVTLSDARSNLAIDSLGNNSDGGATAMRPYNPGQASQHWEMIATDDGWFQLRNRVTGKCLDNVGNQGAGAAMAVWSCGGHPNQQWHLVR